VLSLIACFCNSRSVIPGAGDGPTWPVYALWVAQITLALVAVTYWLLRLRAKRDAHD
jgi:hypothetical protein